MSNRTPLEFLEELLRILRSRKWILITAACAGMAFAVAGQKLSQNSLSTPETRNEQQAPPAGLGRDALEEQFEEISSLMAAQQKRINSLMEAADRDAAADPGESLPDLKRIHDDAVRKKIDEQQKLSRLEACLEPGADIEKLRILDFAPHLRPYIEKVAGINETLGNMWLEGSSEEELNAAAARLELQRSQQQLKAEVEKTSESIRKNLLALEADEQYALDRYNRKLAAQRSISSRAQELSRLQDAMRSLSKTVAVLESRIHQLNAPQPNALDTHEAHEAAAKSASSSGGLGFVLLMGLCALLLSALAVAAGEAFRAETPRNQVSGLPGLAAREAAPAPVDLRLPKEIRRSYDSLSLLLRRNAHLYRTLMITSSLPKEGKTTVALNLARTLASSGERTVLLDFDLRKIRIDSMSAARGSRSQDRIFSPVPGLNLRLETTSSPALHVIVPAQVPDCLPFIFSRPEIETLMRYLRSRYDWVLIDTPAITSVKDPMVIAPLADAVLFVIRQGFEDRRIVKNSMAALDQAIARPVITVINDFGLKRISPVAPASGIGLIYAATERIQ